MTTNEKILQDRCERCDCAESGAPDAQALLAEARAQAVEARRERDEARAWERAARETARLLGSVLGRYTTQRRCRLAALLWRSARSRRLRERLRDAEVAAEQGVLVARDLEERLRAERAMGMELRASLVEALRGLVEAAQVLASSHAEMHDNAILLETVDEPADRAICAARAALEVEP